MRQYMKGMFAICAFAAVALLASAATIADCDTEGAPAAKLDCIAQQDTDFHVQHILAEGRRTFRFDTFGDEGFWGDTIKLHQAIEGTRFGGVGPGVSPKTALAVGLKVGVDALPSNLGKKSKERASQFG
jgi:hypothetical protein